MSHENPLEDLEQPARDLTAEETAEIQGGLTLGASSDSNDETDDGAPKSGTIATGTGQKSGTTVWTGTVR